MKDYDKTTNFIDYFSLNTGLIYQTANEMTNAEKAAGKLSHGFIKLGKNGASLGNILKATWSTLNGFSKASLIIGAISIAFSVISKLHKSAADVKESAESALSEFVSASKDLASTNKNINSISDDYQKLAKGVDELGKNISLTTDEYARYNEIVNQIAELFPSMVLGYTDEGNAIIANKGNIEQLTEAYQNLRKEKANALLNDADDIFKDFKNGFKTTFWPWDTASTGRQYTKLKEIIPIIDNTIKLSNVLARDLIHSDNTLNDIGQSIGIKFPYSSIQKINLLQNPETKVKLEKYLTELTSDLNTEIQSNLRIISQQFLENRSSEYDKLSPIAKNQVQLILSQIDIEYLESISNGNIRSIDENDLYSSIIDDFVKPLQDSDLSAEIQSAFNLQTSFNDNSVTIGNYEEKLHELLNLIGSLPDETQRLIKFLFDIKTDENGNDRLPAEEFKERIKNIFKIYDLIVNDEELDKLNLGQIQIVADFDISQIAGVREAVKDKFDEINKDLKKYSDDGNVNLSARKRVYGDTVRETDLKRFDSNYNTTEIRGDFLWQGNEENGKYVYVHYTPLLSNGEILNKENLNNYLYEQLEGSDDILEADNRNKGIIIKVDEVAVSEAEVNDFKHGIKSDNLSQILINANKYNERLHQAQKKTYEDLHNSSVIVADDLTNVISNNITNFGTIFNDIVLGNRDTIDNFQKNVETLQSSLASLKDSALSTSEQFDLMQTILEMQPDFDFSQYTDEKGIINFDSALRNVLTLITKKASKDIPELADYFKIISRQSLKASKSISSMSDELSKLTEKTKLKNNIEDFIDNGKNLDVEMIQSIASIYPELELELSNYQLNLISTQDLYDSFLTVYQNDLQNYSLYLAEKKGADVEYYKSFVELLPQRLKDMADFYNIELKNYDTYNEAKLAMDSGLEVKKLNVLNTKDRFEKAQKKANSSDATSGDKQIAMRYEVQYDDAVKDLASYEQWISEITNRFIPPDFIVTLDGTSDASKTTESMKDFIESLDWADNTITNLQHNIDLLNMKLSNTKGFKDQIELINELIPALGKLKEGYETSATTYNTQYENALSKLDKLDPTLKSRYKVSIESDTEFSIEDFIDKNVKSDKEGYREKIKKILDEALPFYKQAKDAEKNALSIGFEINDENLKKTQIEIDQLTAKRENLELDVDLVVNALDKNDIIDSSLIPTLEEIYEKELSIAETEEEKSRLEKEKDKTISELYDQKLQNLEKELEIVRSTYDSNDAINQNYNEQINLLEQQCIKLKEIYTLKKQNSTLSDADKKQLDSELHDKLLENQLKKFNAIGNYYDSRKSYLANQQTSIHSVIELLSSRGMASSMTLYQDLANIENQTLSELQSESAALKNQLDELLVTGKIEKYSDQWYKLTAQIQTVDQTILTAAKNIYDFGTQIENIRFDQFDRLIDKIKEVSDESDFLISLLDKNEMFTSGGDYTAEGLSVQGLHLQNFETYQRIADEYREALESLDRQYANDQNNTRYLERRKNLLSSFQDTITAAEAEKQAVIDLANEGIQALIDAEREAAEVKKEAVNAAVEQLDKEKELHDYQESIAEKTKNLAAIQKEINALGGDDSEANRKKLRDLKQQAAEAQKELDDAQYEHSVEAQKEALQNESDNLDQHLKDYEMQMDEYAKNTEQIFQDTLNSVINNSSTIGNTINSAAEDVGYKITNNIAGAWDNAGTSLFQYADTMYLVSTGITSVIDSIKNSWEAAAQAAENYASTQSHMLNANSPALPPDTADTSSTLQRVLEVLRRADGQGAGTSGLNEYVQSLTDQATGKNFHQLSYGNMAELAKILGVSDIYSGEDMIGNTEKKNEILNLLTDLFSSSSIIKNTANSKNSGGSEAASVRAEELVLSQKYGTLLPLTGLSLTAESTMMRHNFTDTISLRNDSLNALQTLKSPADAGISLTVENYAPLIGADKIDIDVLKELQNDPKLQRVLLQMFNDAYTKAGSSMLSINKYKR